MAKFTDWESYFYPETYDAGTGQGVLRNKFGQRDFFELRALEYRATAQREQEMHAGVAQIDRTFGADHLRAIHGYLFQDVYEWAGLRELLRQMHHSPVPHEHSDPRIDAMTPA